MRLRPILQATATVGVTRDSTAYSSAGSRGQLSSGCTSSLRHNAVHLCHSVRISHSPVVVQRHLLQEVLLHLLLDFSGHVGHQVAAQSQAGRLVLSKGAHGWAIHKAHVLVAEQRAVEQRDT